MKYPKRSQYKHTKSRYRVRNWSEYEAGLQKRGDLTVWLSDTALDAWRAPASGKPGGKTHKHRATLRSNLVLSLGGLSNVSQFCCGASPPTSAAYPLSLRRLQQLLVRRRPPNINRDLPMES